MSDNKEKKVNSYDLNILAGVPACAGLIAYTRWGDIATAAFVALVAFIFVMSVMGGTAASIAGALSPRLSAIVHGLWGKFSSRNNEAVVHDDPLMLKFGANPDTGADVYLNINDMQHNGIFAQTGSGKSTLIEYLLTSFVKISPRDLMLVIFDPKGHDFRIWRRIANLALPVVGEEDSDRAIEWIRGEMSRREDLFNGMPKDRKCSSLADYNRLRDELNLTNQLPNMPVLICLYDEFQDVVSENSMPSLVRLFKRSRAYGIYGWPITQRSNVGAIPNDIQDQLPTKLVGYMPSNQAYATIAKVPKETYLNMGRKRAGRWMLQYLGEWSFVHTPMVTSKQVEAIARKASVGNSEPEWPVIDTDESPAFVRRSWSGSRKNKETMFDLWVAMNGFSEKPSADQFMAEFDASENTARTWIDRLWNG